MTKEAALSAKKQHPEALLLVHPECKEEVVQLADYAAAQLVLSISQKAV